MSRSTIHLGDCLAVLPTLADASVDAVVTDPPYGLSFMGKKWDYDVPSVAVWEQCLRVLKPGGHLLAFAGTRTQHRMCCRIEDAGFEIRDMIAWVYGSGFPKSLDVSKAIDKAAGAEREVVGSRVKAGIGGSQTFAQDAWTQANRGAIELPITAPATPDAQRFSGWGTALKPAMEPITVARKPLEGTVAANVLKHGTGAINVDGCRVAASEEDTEAMAEGRKANRTIRAGSVARGFGMKPEGLAATEQSVAGRWPANLIHDGSDEVVGMFPDCGEAGVAHFDNAKPSTGYSGGWKRQTGTFTYGDAGSAARFFYCAKASAADRDDGLSGMDAVATRIGAEGHTINPMTGREIVNIPRRNHHPTVKPTDLMRYLCRLVTPPGGVVLDPFMGSGSTGKAAMLEGFRFVGVEREAEYVAIARARIAAEMGLFHVGLGVGDEK